MEERERLVQEKEHPERINAEAAEVFRLEYEEVGQFIKKQNQALEESLLKRSVRRTRRRGVQAEA